MDKLSTEISNHQSAGTPKGSNSERGPLIVEWKLTADDAVTASAATDSCGGGKDAIFPQVDTSVYSVEGTPGA